MEQQDKKAYEYVMDYFTGRVTRGELKVGDKLPTERDTAEELGVSRNSVREAFHMLEMSGLIECVQGSGNYVKCDPIAYMKKSASLVMALQQTHYEEIFYLRVGYEQIALKLAMKEITEEELSAMQDTLEQMRKTDDPDISAKWDVKFHQQLILASHNRLLIMYASMIADLQQAFIRDYRDRILKDPESDPQLRRAHWNIYYALCEKDLPSGESALQKHFDVVQAAHEKYIGLANSPFDNN